MHAAGAVLLGASVTDTIKSGIAKSSYFTTTPELLMFAMFCVMCTCAFWDVSLPPGLMLFQQSCTNGADLSSSTLPCRTLPATWSSPSPPPTQPVSSNPLVPTLVPECGLSPEAPQD